jgi:cytochrome c biogenesis protein CcmG, thiol:disulfide interchange protein DsbE
MAQTVARRLKEHDMAATLTTGTPAPDLTLPSLDGDPVSLTDLRGKRLLLFFWGSW